MSSSGSTPSVHLSATLLGCLVCVICNYKSLHSFLFKLCIMIVHILKMFCSEVSLHINDYSKTCVKQSLSKRPKMVFKTDYCLKQAKSIPLSFIKLPVVIIFEWMFYTGFTVYSFAFRSYLILIPGVKNPTMIV